MNLEVLPRLEMAIETAKNIVMPHFEKSFSVKAFFFPYNISQPLSKWKVSFCGKESIVLQPHLVKVKEHELP